MSTGTLKLTTTNFLNLSKQNSYKIYAVKRVIFLAQNAQKCVRWLRLRLDPLEELTALPKPGSWIGGTEVTVKSGT